MATDSPTSTHGSTTPSQPDLVDWVADLMPDSPPPELDTMAPQPRGKPLRETLATIAAACNTVQILTSSIVSYDTARPGSRLYPLREALDCMQDIAYTGYYAMRDADHNRKLVHELGKIVRIREAQMQMFKEQFSESEAGALVTAQSAEMKKLKEKLDRRERELIVLGYFACLGMLIVYILWTVQQ